MRLNEEKKQLIADRDQKISQAQSDLEKVNEEKTQREQIAEGLRDRIILERASSEEGKQNDDLSRRLKGDRSALPRTMVEGDKDKAEAQAEGSTSVIEVFDEDPSAVEVAHPLFESILERTALCEEMSQNLMASNEGPRIHPWPTPGFEKLDDPIIYPSPVPKKMSWLAMDKMRRRGNAPMPKKPEQNRFVVSAQYKEDIFESGYPLDDYPLILVFIYRTL